MQSGVWRTIYAPPAKLEAGTWAVASYTLTEGDYGPRVTLKLSTGETLEAGRLVAQVFKDNEALLSGGCVISCARVEKDIIDSETQQPKHISFIVVKRVMVGDTVYRIQRTTHYYPGWNAGSYETSDLVEAKKDTAALRASRAAGSIGNSGA